jgi:hypothetical protein
MFSSEFSKEKSFFDDVVVISSIEKKKAFVHIAHSTSSYLSQ